MELTLLPLSAEIFAKFSYDEATNFALAGGDDYELCFAVPQSKDAEIHALAKKNQLQVARIGEVISGSGIMCTKDGVPFEYTDSGYRHFWKD